VAESSASEEMDRVAMTQTSMSRLEKEGVEKENVGARGRTKGATVARRPLQRREGNMESLASQAVDACEERVKRKSAATAVTAAVQKDAQQEEGASLHEPLSVRRFFDRIDLTMPEHRRLEVTLPDFRPVSAAEVAALSRRKRPRARDQAMPVKSARLRLTTTEKRSFQRKKRPILAKTLVQSQESVQSEHIALGSPSLSRHSSQLSGSPATGPAATCRGEADKSHSRVLTIESWALLHVDRR